MRTIRIYQTGPYHPGDIVELSPSASQHVGVVLRMVVDDPLILFYGNHQEFSATITQVLKKKVLVRIEMAHSVNRESPINIHLAQAISKGERMEWAIQKAVELGVTSITPVITRYCAVKLDAIRMEKKQVQWQAIAIAACEQSERTEVPMIHPICDLSQYLQQSNTSIRLILHPYAAKSWREYDLTESDISLLIGPEGGFSEEEVSQAQHHHFKPLSLGPRILRTETATVAALSVLQAAVGDL